uniref:Uncharacterized protein n=1 Tax=Anopheles dirus TaxID=7168 RepID=A0A182NRZ0_9DIPT
MEPRSEPRTRRAASSPPVKVKKKSTKHTVKFKDQADVREDVLVVTVEPPSPSPGSPEPAPTAAVTFALPPLTTAHRPQPGPDTRALPKKDTPARAKVKGGEQRLAEGCTSLMYACQQGLTGDILKELRQKLPSMTQQNDVRK